MEVYKQPRESFPVVVMMLDFKLYGNIYLVPDKTTADLMNVEKKDFIPLTDVRFFPTIYEDPPPAAKELGRTAFFGMNRNSTLWISGGRAPKVVELSHKTVKVAMVLCRSMIAGEMKIPTAARVTDHLYTSRSWQTVYNASIYPIVEGQSFTSSKAVARYDYITVNAKLATGVIEG